MGDKSPKSKERGQKQKTEARATDAAKAASKQAGQSQFPKTPKDKRWRGDADHQ